MTVTLYGIKNCDTVKKARRWLDANGVDYAFHDFRIDGLDALQLRQWAAAVGWDTLLNRRGTTWRQLPETERAQVDEHKALALMLAQPTLIKRPVLVVDDAVHVGFTDSGYQALFQR